MKRPARLARRNSLAIRSWTRRRIWLQLESLESRQMLDAEGIPWQSANLTVSFAPDGTMVGNQASSLFAELDSLGSTTDWQATILRALQTWSQSIPGNVGLVADTGVPFGTPAPTQGDLRFGDVRVAAIPMDPSVLSVSIPANQLLAGAWAGDILINSQADLGTLDHLFAVMVHEAAHVFGLGDTNDPQSPRYALDQSTIRPPTPTDLADLQARYGTRTPDDWEGLFGNDSRDNAFALDLMRYQGGIEASAPTILFADLSSSSDRDWYSLPVPGDYLGGVTMRIVTRGISTLAPHLRVLDADGNTLAETMSGDGLGGDFSVTFAAPLNQDLYYLEVSSAAVDLPAVGSYALLAQFDGRSVADPQLVGQLVSGSRGLRSQDEIQALLGGEEFLHEDGHSDDALTADTELTTPHGHESGTFFQIDGSISDRSDVDTYRVVAPKTGNGLSLTVDVRPLDGGYLIPALAIYNEDLQPVPFEVLANGLGQLTVQLDGVTVNSEYVIQVRSSDTAGMLTQGNYRLTAMFGPHDVDYRNVAAGSVADTSPQAMHSLYVAQSQLFHFALQADAIPGDTSGHLLLAQIRDSQQQIVHTIATVPGETRSMGSVLLLPGTYSVEIVSVAWNGTLLSGDWNYTLWGAATSDPLAVDPTDPVDNPFTCPGLAGIYCYPGGVVSNDPTWWDVFIGSLPNLPNLPLQQVVNLVLGDWWVWNWQNHGQGNGPTLAIQDAYFVVPDLSLSETQSVLANDRDPEHDPLTAILLAAPTHGALTLNLNGTFNYTPEPGYTGTDSFSYVAYDFHQNSEPAQVQLHVVENVADLNQDGTVDALDATTMFASWQTYGAGWQHGDVNLDGVIDAADAGALFGLWTGDPGLATLPTGSATGSKSAPVCQIGTVATSLTSQTDKQLSNQLVDSVFLHQSDWLATPRSRARWWRNR